MLSVSYVYTRFEEHRPSFAQLVCLISGSRGQQRMESPAAICEPKRGLVLDRKPKTNPT